jgi:hypothetical protein
MNDAGQSVCRPLARSPDATDALKRRDFLTLLGGEFLPHAAAARTSLIDAYLEFNRFKASMFNQWFISGSNYV